MAIEAVSGLSAGMNAQAPQPVQADAATSIQHQDASPSSEAAESFRETLGKVHDDLAKFQPDASQNSAKADPVEAAKADILPSPWKASVQAQSGGAPAQTSAQPAASGATNPTSSATSDGNNVLRKSFDHAIYVTLVSQVVGGLSQTTSTLIKQQ